MAGGNGSALLSELPTEWPHPQGDPRERFPALAAAGVFTPRRLIKWATDRRCLCGCGRQTKQLQKRWGPQGHSYFTHHCWPKLSVKHNLRTVTPAPARRDPVWLEATRRENEDRYCTLDDTRWYVGMILADCHDREITIAAWAREKNLSQESVYQWIHSMRYGTRIAKYNAGRILKALGEQMPPDIKARYDGRLAYQKRRKRTLAKAS